VWQPLYRRGGAKRQQAGGESRGESKHERGGKGIERGGDARGRGNTHRW